MDPFRSFDAAMLRAEHLLKLYDMVCDSAERDANVKWAAGFKASINWPAQAEVSRVYGKDRKSILIFQRSIGVDRSHFSHTYASELLRAALVASVSALDRCMHDLIVKYIWQTKDWFEREDMPRELRELSIPLHEVFAAVRKAREPGSKPGALVRKVLQEQLTRKTFQSPDDVAAALRILGIKDVWGRLALELGGDGKARTASARLQAICKRRNQIVHEADLELRIKASTPTLRDIGADQARADIAWMRSLGEAIRTVVTRHLNT